MTKSTGILVALVALALSAAGTAQTTTVYSYTVPANGYAPNGNLSAYTDSVMGTWAMQYDSMNRLQNAAASAGPYQGVNLQWGFDSFGNRTSQIPSGTSNASLPGPSSPSYNAHNQVVSGNGSFTPTYDAAGNMTFDGAATYTAYDGDNRVCATYSTIGGSGVTQYIYNAEGQRVAKGHPVSSPGNTPFCPTDMANFVADSKYVLGPSGEQMTEVDGSGTWRHTNVYNGGQMLATYDTHGVHFPQTDPLGTVRVQASATGAAEESCASLPFGDGLNCTPSISEPTEHHFTGKERDAESGLDYFGARYYASSTGRWMSPDWADKPEAVPYSDLSNPQSLNLYGYVNNNPLSHADKDGHEQSPLDPKQLASMQQDIARASAAIKQFATDHPILTNLGINLGLAIITRGEGEGVSMPRLTEGGALPDSAPVVRGGLPQNIPNGTGVSTDANGNLQGVSVNSGAGKTVEQLSQGLPQNKIGTTTVGEVRAAGGDVKQSPTPNNPNHCTMCGVTPQKATEILKVSPNPTKAQGDPL